MSIDLKKAKNLSTTLDYALYYRSIGISIIPLAPRSKEPPKGMSWKQYQERLPTEEEVRQWFTDNNYNIGIITGSVSGNLVVIDFDNRDIYQDAVLRISKDPGFSEKFFSTWIDETGKGYHIYFRINTDKETFKKLFRQKIKIEGRNIDIKGEGGYVVAPPSIHPDTKAPYTFIKGPPIVPAPVMLSLSEFEKLMRLIGIDPEKLWGTELKSKPETECRKLGENEIERIVDLLAPYYIKGHRDHIIMYTLGAFIKANICHDTAWGFVDRITAKMGDEERRKRLYLVDYHYGRRIASPGIEKLKGLSGLREEIERILKAKGEPEDIVTQKASEVIAEISSILGVRKESGGVAWLERDDDGISKWVAVGKQGIYVYKRSARGKVVKIISNAKIGEVKNIKVVGLDFKDFYSVDLEGEKIIGTVDEIIDIIKKRYGIEPGYQYAIARLIDYMAEDEEELYYSPGPWVVDGKVVFAHEPGYTPTWKKYVRWNIRTDDPGEEAIRKALETIKTLVLSYRDPTKPSAVLSYAVVSTIAYYIKEKLSIFPHLIIHGLNETGKSVLLDFIKLLFGITWNDEIPGTEYQARLLLTTSTLPAIVDEMGSVLTSKNAQAVLGVLHDSATKIAMRISGGHEYAGYYLAVRALIGATNSDISLLPWQIDKFIFIGISRKEAIDVTKARGFTPRTMDPNTKLAVQYVGYLLLKGLEEKLSEIDKLRELPRDELKKRLLEIGYSVWVDLYRKYGLEPFPPPAEGRDEITNVSVEEEYRDIFMGFIYKCINRTRNDLPLILPFGEKTNIEEDTSALDALETHHIIRDEITNELIMKPTFLTEFMQWASKEYGVPYLGWRRLAEILGMKQTTRKIGGKTIKNLLVFDLNSI